MVGSTRSVVLGGGTYNLDGEKTCNKTDICMGHIYCAPLPHKHNQTTTQPNKLLSRTNSTCGADKKKGWYDTIRYDRMEDYVIYDTI